MSTKEPDPENTELRPPMSDENSRDNKKVNETKVVVENETKVAIVKENF